MNDDLGRSGGGFAAAATATVRPAAKSERLDYESEWVEALR